MRESGKSWWRWKHHHPLFWEIHRMDLVVSYPPFLKKTWRSPKMWDSLQTEIVSTLFRTLPLWNVLSETASRLVVSSPPPADGIRWCGVTMYCYQQQEHCNPTLCWRKPTATLGWEWCHSDMMRVSDPRAALWGPSVRCHAALTPRTKGWMWKVLGMSDFRSSVGKREGGRW